MMYGFYLNMTQIQHRHVRVSKGHLSTCSYTGFKRSILRYCPVPASAKR